MQTRFERVETDDTEPSPAGDLLCYQDNGALVMCDRTNPKAWIRSTLTTPVES